jgi:hypothetical protein
MNVENLNKAIELIASIPPQKFDMSVLRAVREGDEIHDDTRITDHELIHGCGTIACIAGWVATLNPDDAGIGPYHRAQQYLDLDHQQTGQLFCPEGYSYLEFTRDEALTAMRHLAQTGEVCWQRFSSTPVEG